MEGEMEGTKMGKCVIFCAAGFSGLLEPIGKDDLLIAADGGLLHTQNLGLSPDLILGDFDSLGYVPTGSQVFPVEKDDTDAMLAIRQGLRRGYREFVLYGSLDGPRLDHTVANFQALQYLCDQGACGTLVGREQLVTAVKNGFLSFPAGMEGTVSVFCHGPEAAGVTLEGLYYPLKNAPLSPGFPLGVSNHFTGAPAKIQVESGTLLVIWDRQNGADPRIARG